MLPCQLTLEESIAPLGRINVIVIDIVIIDDVDVVIVVVVVIVIVMVIVVVAVVVAVVVVVCQRGAIDSSKVNWQGGDRLFTSRDCQVRSTPFSR